MRLINLPGTAMLRGPAMKEEDQVRPSCSFSSLHVVYAAFSFLLSNLRRQVEGSTSPHSTSRFTQSKTRTPHPDHTGHPEPSPSSSPIFPFPAFTGQQGQGVGGAPLSCLGPLVFAVPPFPCLDHSCLTLPMYDRLIKSFRFQLKPQNLIQRPSRTSRV